MARSRKRKVIRAGNITLDLRARLAINGTGPIPLTPQECKLLAVLMQHPEETLTRDFLMRTAWDWDITTPEQARTLEVHICWLRRKLEHDPRRPVLIHTVRGTGYRFAPTSTTTP